MGNCGRLFFCPHPRTDAVTLVFSYAGELFQKWMIYGQLALDRIAIIDVFERRASRTNYRKCNSRRHFAAISRAFAATYPLGTGCLAETSSSGSVELSIGYAMSLILSTTLHTL